MPKTENHNQTLYENREPLRPTPGRILALDLGARRVGVAVSDELLVTVSPLKPLKRTNWKQLLRDVEDLCMRYDVKKVVLGLPLRLDGSEGDAAIEARRISRNLSLSLRLPVFLQDERYTSLDAEKLLRAERVSAVEIKNQIDSKAAAIILSDFISSTQQSFEK